MTPDGPAGSAGRPSALKLRELSAHVGVEVSGLDLTRDLDAETIAHLRETWIRYGVILFPEAGVSIDAHVRISQCFGDLEPSAHGAKRGLNLAENPYIMDASYDPNKSNVYSSTLLYVNGAERAGFLGWHWDQSFMPKMVRGRVLRAITPAKEGGETGFIDAIGAYQRLPARLKSRIENLEVVYEYNTQMETNRFGFPKDIRVVRRNPDIEHPKFDPVVYPMVITQRETGKKVLKLSPMHCRYILGIDPQESDALLAEIADHLVDERYAYFHTWKQNDLILYDNWRIIHSVKGFKPEYPRHMQRSTISGDQGYGRYLVPSSALAAEPERIED